MTGKLGHAWVGAWVGAWHGAWVGGGVMMRGGGGYKYKGLSFKSPA